MHSEDMKDLMHVLKDIRFYLMKIDTTLTKMKEQEHDYWETWKQNKQKELEE